MRNGRFMILFICIFGMFAAQAQQDLHYFFRHIDQADGLLNNQAISIVQDGKGFIWIATPNGLQRYDGSRFIYYPEILSDPSERLTYGAEMYADKKNNLLWILKGPTIEKLALGKNRFTIYDYKKLSKDSSFHFEAYAGNDDYSAMLSANAAFLVNNKTKQNIGQHENVNLADAHIGSYIFKDSVNRQTWFTTRGRVFLFDERTKKVYWDQYNPINHPLLDSSLYNNGENVSRFVLTDNSSDTWVTTWGNNLYRYDPLTKKVSTYFLSGIKSLQQGRKESAAGLLVNCIMEDDNHIIWIGTENAGLLRYNREKDNFDYCITQEKNSESIRYNYKIFSLFQDKEQNIWIGTDKGINIFNPYRQYFRSVRHEDDNINSIPKNEITCFIQTTNGNSFIGTWGGGITEYDSELHFKKNIFFKDKRENNFAWSFLQVDEQTIWIGCQLGYLGIYNMVTGKLLTLQPPEIRSTIRCMEKDNEGNVWLGLHNGKIAKWDKQQNKFIAYQGNAKPDGTVFNIFLDKEQHCWVSTEAGFKEFDKEKMVFSNTWLPDKNNAASLSGKTCEGIEAYNDSTLLIGTIYGGLNFFNKRTKTFSHLGTDDGLPSNTIYAIKKDTANYIWFTTDHGLCKFDPVEKKIISYSIDPGVINAAFTAAKFYPLQDGQWLTFTLAEAISFFPQKMRSQYDNKIKVEITGFKLFDKPLFIDSFLLENKPVQLSYKENFFTVEFAALNFSSLQQTNYYYRLEGIDKDWVNGGTKRFANYTDLQAGEYTFDVRAENAGSDAAITSFKIIISPPFWQTAWFRIIVILAAIMLTYFLFRRRVNTIRHEAELKHRIAETEMMALRAQMNPHFIFNCINSIDALIQSNDKYQATVYLNKFAKLIRNILDSSKQNVVTLSKDMETLQLYIDMEKFRNENKFTVEINADKVLLQDDYKIPPLIIQPYVENAILHGLKNRIDNDGKLFISVSRQNGQIKFVIEDNGVGRQITSHANKDGKRSYGMQMSSDRVKLFNKENDPSVLITDLEKEGKAAGTKVEVLLNI